MLVGILAPNSVGMMGRFSELLCKRQRQVKCQMTFPDQRVTVRNAKAVDRGYLHGGRVCHSLLHHSGRGLGYDASGGLGFDRQVALALALAGPPTGTCFHNENTRVGQTASESTSPGG